MNEEENSSWNEGMRDLKKKTYYINDPAQFSM